VKKKLVQRSEHRVAQEESATGLNRGDVGSNPTETANLWGHRLHSQRGRVCNERGNDGPANLSDGVG
jgi:hypothetical protein